MRRTRYLFTIAGTTLLLATGMLFPATVGALPSVDGPPHPLTCKPGLLINVKLAPQGLSLSTGEGQYSILARSTISISANANASQLTADCKTTIIPITSYSWKVSGPAGASPHLTGDETLNPSFTPPFSGQYEVTFTPCIQVCSAATTLSLRAVNQLVVPNQLRPLDFPSPGPGAGTVFDNMSDRCNTNQFDDLGFFYHPGVHNPQWVTVNRWIDQSSYETLEGLVGKSHISRYDNTLNHYNNGHDINIFVTPDPTYWHLLSASLNSGNFSQFEIENEWERQSIPESFWPSVGDRVSLFGYWIFDCGHDFHTEIHPPVGIAVHRYGAIPIPSNFLGTFPGSSSPQSVGSNVFVPGVVTDIWFNDQGGQTTGDCGETGLHQPGAGTDQCVPSGYDCCVYNVVGQFTNPLRREYNFNIYLPADPQRVASELDPQSKAPDVLLYTNNFGTIDGFGNDGPNPIITSRVREMGPDGIVRDKLTVRLDLSNFDGHIYARRITAAWVYPAPDNWSLQSWDVTVDSIKILDNSHGDAGQNEGRNWFFWFNTNGAWTNLLEDKRVFSGDVFDSVSAKDCTSPWRTGNGDCNLGPSLLLYPGQSILVHTSGYVDGSPDDRDLFETDDTGTVYDFRQQISASYDVDAALGSMMCQEEPGTFLFSQCGRYLLRYSIIGGQQVPAQLSQGAQSLYNAYTFFAPEFPLVFPCADCVAILERWNPFNMPLPLGSEPVALENTLLFEPQDPEENALTGISLIDLQQLIRSAYSADPQRVERFLTELRRTVDKLRPSGVAQTDSGLLVLFQIRTSVPPDVWNRHFGDLPSFQVTFSQLCALSRQVVSNPTLATGMCKILTNAETLPANRKGLVAAYLRLLQAAQEINAVKASQADILRGMAATF
jgi:hypothetical protein